MNFIRDFRVLTWTAVLFLMASVLLYAYVLGAGSVEAAVVKVPMSSSAAKQTIADLDAMTGSGLAAGSNPQQVASWAAAVEKKAQEGLDLREAEGAGPGDVVWESLDSIREGADLAQAGVLEADADVAAYRRDVLERIIAARASVAEGRLIVYTPSGMYEPQPVESPVAAVPTKPKASMPKLPKEGK